MFERFTERARQVVVLAQDEARTLKHSKIGTEHLLLGVIREEQGAAAHTLDELGVTLDDVRERVIAMNESADEIFTGQIPFVQEAKLALEWALRTALQLGHNYIGTEHLLLGMFAQREDTAAKRILLECGIDPDKGRQGILNILNGKLADAPVEKMIVEAPASVKELDYREMSVSDLKWLIIKATTELVRRANISS
jgi:ATP-dependent Clp protease ATP-binding subunit ClpC